MHTPYWKREEGAGCLQRDMPGSGGCGRCHRTGPGVTGPCLSATAVVGANGAAALEFLATRRSTFCRIGCFDCLCDYEIKSDYLKSRKAPTP
jgi:hypothetical protein